MNEDHDALIYVCHEIANPLNSLLLRLYMLRDEKGAKSELIANAIGDIHRVRRLIDDARNFNDFSLKPANELEKFSLNELICDLIECFFLKKREKSITIKYLCGFFGSIKADKQRIHQALGNILDNAIKFSPIGSEVRISLYKNSGYAEIEVQDSGPGIDPVEFESIFLKDYRVKSRSKEGYGLGLFLVRKFIETHRGEVLVNSDGESGSTFLIRLPLAEDLTSSEAFEQKFFSFQSSDRSDSLPH